MPALTTITILGVTFQTLYAVAFIASVTLSYVISSLTQPDGLRGSNQTDPGVRSQVPPDSTTSVPVVYGKAFLGGRFVDACIRENDQAVMYYVQAISCVSVNGQIAFDITNMYYGDRRITFDTVMPNRVASLTDGAGNVATDIYDRLFISLYKADENGNITAFNTAGKMPWEQYNPPGYTGNDSTLMGVGSGIATAQQWTATGRRMNGLVFAIIRLSYSREAGTTQLQPVTYCMSQTLNMTGEAKPGDVWYDYMTNPVYGAAIEPQFVDNTSRTALNAYSDELITFNDYNGNPQTQARYRINGVVDTNKAVLKNIDDIMQACDSWLRYEASTGLWSVTINKAETPALALNDNNIIGSIVVGTVDLAQTVNVVEAKFPDSTNRDQYNYVNEAVPAWLLYPNEPLNKQTLTYELVNDSVQALYLANRVLEQGREDLTITVNTTYVGIQLSAGDVVSITNAAYGWTNKLFRCMQVQESVTQEGSLGAQLQLAEYNAQVYDNFDITQFTPAPNTNLPSSYYFSALSAPTVENPEPAAVIPVFDVQCGIPVTGRVTNVSLYYTTVATPTATDWTLWGTQSLPNSQPYAPSTNVLFDNLNLKPATYYFAYKVSNETATSILSPISTAFIWNPTPANAGTFVATFQPATIQVPYVNNAPVFTGISWRLYGTTNLGEVEFVTAQTDSDPSFVNNSWRIGYNATTGWADIVSTNITVPTLTDGGTYAQWGAPTAMTADTATIAVPIRYKDSSGNVSNVPVAILQFAYTKQGDPGTSGNKNAIAYLYQWNTAIPSNPNGTSTFNWATLTNSSYTGGNGWSTTIPANSGVPLLKLYQASKGVTAVSSATTSTVDWTSGFAIADVTSNGAAGTQVATPTIYQWAITIPAGPSGTSTYTWASGSFTPIPSGWSATPGTAPSAGYTLWGATVQLIDVATATTATINWTTASVTARGYAGTNGVNGTRTAILDMYIVSATTPTSFPSGTSTYTWATGQFTAPATPNGWSLTPPAPIVGQTLYVTRQVYADSGTSATSSVTWTASTATPFSTSGNNGTRTAFLELYRWSATTPTTFPSGASTYTWATGAFTLPATPNSWSLTPGAAVAGSTLWGCQQTYADTNTTATSTVTWSTSTAYPVGYAGSNGANASVLTLTSTGQAITFNGDGTADPASQTITFTANLQNLTGTATFVATAYNASGTSLGTITLGGTGNTRTLTNAQFISLTGTDRVVVTATLSTYSDTITIVKLQDGTNAITGYLTNEAVTLSADSSGTVSSYTPANGKFKVYNGTTDVSASTTFSLVSNTGCTAAITSTGVLATTGAISVSAMSAPTATAVFQAVYGGVTIQKTLSLAKSFAGDTGTTGASARICYTKTTLSSLDSTPSIITTSGSSSFPPNNSWGSGTIWQATSPSITAGESVYQSDGIYDPSTNITTWNVPYLSTLKVGSLSAISANLGQITSGTITGSLIRTAATGQRIEIDYVSNTLRGYNSAGTQLVEIGGTSGSVYATTTVTNQIPIVGYGGTLAGGIAGTSTNASGVFGQSSTSNGVYAQSTSGDAVAAVTVSGYGVYANSQGVWDFYAGGTAGNYGPFTGGHDCIIQTGINIGIGYIVQDVKCVCKKNVSNTIFEVEITSQPNQPAIGVFIANQGLLNQYRPSAFTESVSFDEQGQPTYIMYPEYDLYKDNSDYCQMNALGEGQVMVCGENGNISKGDLIVTSSTNGVGMKQADDIVRNYTVAKAREDVVFETASDTKLVACIYLCG